MFGLMAVVCGAISADNRRVSNASRSMSAAPLMAFDPPPPRVGYRSGGPRMVIFGAFFGSHTPLRLRNRKRPQR